MISPKQLITMARKRKTLAAMSRKRITIPRTASRSSCNSLTVDEGHFVVYTADQRCFVIPLAYLRNAIFRELLRMAEEEYGLPSHKPITLPCDSVFMEYAVSLMRRQAAGGEHLEKAVIMTVTTGQSLSQPHVSNKNNEINAY